jgi:hypothetical protein
VCPPGSYELQYKVKQNRFYTDRFANVMLAKVQRDVTRELRQRKVIYLCSPVYTRVLKGCFHVSLVAAALTCNSLGDGQAALHSFSRTQVSILEEKGCHCTVLSGCHGVRWQP